MPFTPFHLGPSLLLGLILFPLLALPTLLIASVIVDLEPLFLMLSPSIHVGELHGFFHTHLGATLAGLALIPILYVLRNPLSELLRLFGLPQHNSLFKISLTSLLGVNLHVLLDSFLYFEMNPFFPLLGNPFYGLVSSPQVYLFCTICFLAAVPVYLYHIIRYQRRKDAPMRERP